MKGRYYLFGTEGPTRIPSREETVRLARKDGIVIVLLLDANVCLDLANYASRSLASHDLERVIRFLGRVKRSGVDTAPAFGLIELSLVRSSFTLDSDKFALLERKVSYSLEVPASRLANPPRFELDSDPQPLDSEALLPWLPVFQLLYACILKILVISRMGLAKERALDNVRLFLQWMCDDLDVLTVLPLQIAYAVFGGDNRARRLIGVDDRGDPQKRAWGAAWDVFHVQNLARIQLNPMETSPERLIFVTRDVACYEVFSQTRNFGGLRLSLDKTLPLTEISSQFPHFESRQDELSQLVRHFTRTRISKITNSKPRQSGHFAGLISALEADLMRQRE